jgi:hypothetical protein
MMRPSNWTSALFLVGALGSSAALAVPELSVPASSTVCEGATVAVPISAADLDPSISLDFLLQFDPAVIEPTSVATSVMTAGCTLDWNVTGGSADEIDIAISCLEPRSGSGVVAYLFVKGVTPSGTSDLDWLSAETDENPGATTVDGVVMIDAGSGSSTLRMASVVGGAGGVVDLPVLGTMAPGSISINAEVHWDPAVLTGIGVEVSESLPPGCFVDPNFTGPGVALFSVYCVAPLSGPHHLANVRVLVNGDAGAQTSIDLVSGAVNEDDACLEDGLFTAVSGVVVSVPVSSNVCSGAETALPVGVAIGPDDEVLGLDLVLDYDPLVVVPTQVVPAAVTAGCLFDWNVPAAGQLAISIFCTAPLASAGPVAYVFFEGLGVSGSSSPLDWVQHDLNEGQIASSHQDGVIHIVDADAALSMPDGATAGAGGVVHVPVEGVFPSGTIGVNMIVAWDPAILTAQAVAPSESLPPGWIVDADLSTAGQATIAVYGTIPIGGTQVLARIQFDVVGGPGAVTPLDVVSGSVNEADACLDDGLLMVASGPLISVPASTCACPGTEASVPISISPADGVIGLDLALDYDAGLFLPVGVTLAPLAQDCMLDWNIPVAGQLAIAINCTVPLDGSGVVAHAAFQGIGSPPATSPLTWSLHDLNEGAIPSSSVDGELCLSSAPGTLSVPDDAGSATGFSVEIPLGADLAGGTIGVNAVLNWDPTALTASSALIAPGLPADWLLEADLGTPGSAGLSLYGTTGLAGSQTLAVIEFDVIGDTGTSTPLDLSFGEANEIGTCLDDGLLQICPLETPVDDSLTLEGQGPTTLSWLDPPGPYRVYRGSRITGNPWAYNHVCSGLTVVGSSAEEPLTPPPHVLYYYLITRGECGESIPGSDSSSVAIPNPHRCPTTVTDDDGDDANDVFDNCPGLANDQADGDGDSHGDDCDNCPTDANADQSDVDGDLLGDACDRDIDEDGEPNGSDNCPSAANPGQENGDGDALGDVCDPCPAVPNPCPP